MDNENPGQRWPGRSIARSASSSHAGGPMFVQIQVLRACFTNFGSNLVEFDQLVEISQRWPEIVQVWQEWGKTWPAIGQVLPEFGLHQTWRGVARKSALAAQILTRLGASGADFGDAVDCRRAELGRSEP